MEILGVFRIIITLKSLFKMNLSQFLIIIMLNSHEMPPKIRLTISGTSETRKFWYDF